MHVDKHGIATLFPYTTLFRSPRSKSSRTIAGDLPPSWSVQRAMRSPQIESMRRPAAVEPVKLILSTPGRSEEHTSELQSRRDLVCRLLLEKKYIKVLILMLHR